MIDKNQPLPEVVWVTSRARIAKGMPPMKVYPTGESNFKGTFYGRPAGGRGGPNLYTSNESFLTKEEADSEALQLILNREREARIEASRVISRMASLRDRVLRG